MPLHRCHERAVSDDNFLRSHGEGEGDIQGVICAVVDGEADFQRDVVQAEIRSRRRLHLRAQQRQRFPRLVRCEQLSPHLEPPEPLSDTPAIQEPVLLPADAALARRKGRPAGKRSDPAWKPYTVLIRKETHKGVSRRLQDMDVGQDLSELVDELLAEWLKR
jgi:hypothetical protein